MNVKKLVTWIVVIYIYLLVCKIEHAVLLRSNNRSNSAAIVIACTLYLENDEKINQNHDMHNTVQYIV